MAITAHWIDAKKIQTPEGLQHCLNLRLDLINFHYVPGHHTGVHLTHAFLEILDQIGITHKVSISAQLFAILTTL